MTKATEGESESPAATAPNESLLHRLAGPSCGKAGLKRDPEEVKRIIYETSKGSPFFLNERKKDEEQSKRVEALNEKLNKLVQMRRGNLQHEEMLVDQMIRELEQTRDLSQVVAVVDADAFYASVHEFVDPELRGIAFGVGSINSVLCTASYEARKWGVTSGMAGFIAKKLCPHLKFVGLDFPLYTRISKQIMEILETYGLIAPASLDEAYMSITEHCASVDESPAEVTAKLRERVKLETGCTVSVGVSPNTMISKIAADVNKPDGQFVVESTREGCMAFMGELSVRKIPGIGRVTERLLQSIGINKVSDVYRLRGKLYLIKNEVGLDYLLRAYLGIGSTFIHVRDRSERKSVSSEQTFQSTSEPEKLCKILKDVACDLAKQMKAGNWKGRTLTLKIKLDSFEVLNRSATRGKEYYFSDEKTFYREAKFLLDREIQTRKLAFKKGKMVKGNTEDLHVRLLGIRMSNLKDIVYDKPFKKEQSNSYDATTFRFENTKIRPFNKYDNPEELTRGEEADDDITSAEKIYHPPSSGSSAMFWEGFPDMDPSMPEEPDIADEQPRTPTPEPSDKGSFFTGISSMECPVCSITLVCSEVGMSHHVNTHFATTKKKRKI